MDGRGLLRIALISLALGCGGSAGASAVTVERLSSFDNAKVNEHAADFDKCLGAARAQLGEPSLIEGNEYWWAATRGDDCHAYVLVSNGDGMMSRSKGPYKVGSDELERCREMAG